MRLLRLASRGTSRSALLAARRAWPVVQYPIDRRSRDKQTEGTANILSFSVSDYRFRRDSSRAHVYGQVRGILGELQPGGPYGM
jgi:hypothetical protein